MERKTIRAVVIDLLDLNPILTLEQYSDLTGLQRNNFNRHIGNLARQNYPRAQFWNEISKLRTTKYLFPNSVELYLTISNRYDGQYTSRNFYLWAVERIEELS